MSFRFICCNCNTEEIFTKFIKKKLSQTLCHNPDTAFAAVFIYCYIQWDSEAPPTSVCNQSTFNPFRHETPGVPKSSGFATLRWRSLVYLHIVICSIQSILAEQLSMSTAFSNTILRDHNNLIRIANGRQPVRDRNGSTIF